MECTGQVFQVTYRVPLEFITRVNGANNDGSTTLTNSFLRATSPGYFLFGALGPATVVSLFNTALFGCLTGLLQGFSFYSIRLSVRTLGFQPSKRGSTPLSSTNFGDAATMVEWPRTVNPVLKKRNRFESYHLHQTIPGD